jgi:hypothetical protein
MTKLVGAALLVFIAGCSSLPFDTRTVAYSLSTNNFTITLYREPCSGKTKELLPAFVPPPFHDGMKNAEGVFRTRAGSRQTFQGCWFDVPPEFTGGAKVVYLLFEDGDQYIFSKDQFTKNSL